MASDIVTFRQRPHEEWPELPRHEYTVSRSDLATQRERGKNQVPLRDKKGMRLSAIYDRLPAGLAAAYAKRNGHPFTVHIANIDAAEEIP